MGIQLSIDDFGTGYSSLSYLTRLSVDKLKVDQSFVRGLGNNQDDAAVVRTIIQLGHSLGLKVIAEGVESQSHLTFLSENGCDEAQGYHFSKPLSAEDFAAYVRAFPLPFARLTGGDVA
jgi:EAL domain-containing protein (putative c-di-GMP-specific phosphodiesterase class I)